MAKLNKALVIKILIAFMILALMLSVKTVILVNLENIGVAGADAANIRAVWDDYKADYIFIITALAVSFFIALKFNIKGE